MEPCQALLLYGLRYNGSGGFLIMTRNPCMTSAPMCGNNSEKSNRLWPNTSTGTPPQVEADPPATFDFAGVLAANLCDFTDRKKQDAPWVLEPRSCPTYGLREASLPSWAENLIKNTCSFCYCVVRQFIAIPVPRVPSNSTHKDIRLRYTHFKRNLHMLGCTHVCWTSVSVA